MASPWWKKRGPRPEIIPDGDYGMLLKGIIIDVTYECNLKCYDCNRGCDFSRDPDLISVKQIDSFVDESISLGWNWNKIVLEGGEPTLHPDLNKIFNSLKRYIKFNPKCSIHITSNGYGAEVESSLSKLPSWVIVNNTSKKSRDRNFEIFTCAPVDLGVTRSVYSKGCTMPYRVGLALNKYGYYPCPSGAAVDRYFGVDVGIKSLKDVNVSSVCSKFVHLCKFCGRFNVGEEHAYRMSPSWQKSLNAYSSRRRK